MGVVAIPGLYTSSRFYFGRVRKKRIDGPHSRVKVGFFEGQKTLPWKQQRGEREKINFILRVFGFPLIYYRTVLMTLLVKKTTGKYVQVRVGELK